MIKQLMLGIMCILVLTILVIATPITTWMDRDDDSIIGWLNESGTLNVTSMNIVGLAGTYTNGEAFVCTQDDGTIFANDGGCD